MKMLIAMHKWALDPKPVFVGVVTRHLTRPLDRIRGWIE